MYCVDRQDGTTLYLCWVICLKYIGIASVGRGFSVLSPYQLSLSLPLRVCVCARNTFLLVHFLASPYLPFGNTSDREHFYWIVINGVNGLQRIKRSKTSRRKKRAHESVHIECIRCYSSDLLSISFECVHATRGSWPFIMPRFQSLHHHGPTATVYCYSSIIKYAHRMPCTRWSAQGGGGKERERDRGRLWAWLLNLLISIPLRASALSLFMGACNKCLMLFMTIAAPIGAKRFCIWIAFE